MSFGKIFRVAMWTCTVVFVLMFTILIIVGHTTSFDFYYLR